ncbi:hypothetical protein cce_4676 [Crocosphaera subtropica ATCC 51142]|uniref:Uncharacterized protein n=1 Tax=Crocosphaera subtropica (strain ATCC 51142 / BH68) TaxID=43989 RepID=B1WW96_CROS5|nr:hypothetical protein cce_4676 [Crocosphaera subtropica ATCC 51142]
MLITLSLLRTISSVQLRSQITPLRSQKFPPFI